MKKLMSILTFIWDIIVIIISFLIAALILIIEIVSSVADALSSMLSRFGKLILGAKTKHTTESDSILVKELKALPSDIISPIEIVLVKKFLTYYLNNKISATNAIKAFNNALTTNAEAADQLIKDLKLSPATKPILVDIFKRITYYDYVNKYFLPISFKIRIAHSRLNESEMHEIVRIFNNHLVIDDTYGYDWSDATYDRSIISYFTTAQLERMSDADRSTLNYYNNKI